MSDKPASDLSFAGPTLQDLDSALRREWLVANGLGGYASASLATANTRRYHGLLVAAVNPPLGRAVLLSKIEDSVEVIAPDGAVSPTFALSVNLYPGAVYPQGYRILESFSALPAPVWTWAPQPGVRIEKRIWMAEGRNTTYVSYTLREAPQGSTANLHLVPLVAWKDYHSEMRATDPLDYAWHPPQQRVARPPTEPCGLLSVPLPPIVHVTNDSVMLNLFITDGAGNAAPSVTFLPQQYWFYHFQHPREQERGQDFSEDLLSLGMLSMTLAVGESVTVVATVEDGEPDPPDAAWQALLDRQARIAAAAKGADPFALELSLAVEPFLVQANGARSTIIAGYHWFCDWGRDTMVAAPGLCLETGREDLARDILLSFSRYVDQGMLPNRFPDVGEAPEYNTVDATLWYFAAIYRYVAATGDRTLVETLWPILEEIVRCHREGTRYNIRVDSDNLLTAGQHGVQLTWMDARIGDWVVTPRIGKAVEVNALWHNALKSMAHFARLLDKADSAGDFEQQARVCAAIFAARFPRHDGRGLADVLDTPNNNAPDESIRPNQIFAVSLPFAPIDAASPLARSVVDVVASELLTPFGLRTLAPEDAAYRPRYEGDSGSRDGAYHQGTVWPWLLGSFAEAHYRVYGDRAKALSFLQPLQAEMSGYGVGSLPEVYDGSDPQRPNGCIAQAWSVGETLRVWNYLQARPAKRGRTAGSSTKNTK
ncbi:MAG TPA: amylo-alpha-1,6-glucosidase [Chthonomonadaceae bacterium]|nr:amylo-alpha-1,6-glucosidase [Chthonomonadaceae bacterium]